MLPMAKIRTFGVHASAKGGTADARRSRADIHSQSGQSTGTMSRLQVSGNGDRPARASAR
jgi:hypothetical protein